MALYLNHLCVLLKVIDQFPEQRLGQNSRDGGRPRMLESRQSATMLMGNVRAVYTSIALLVTIGKTLEFFPSGDPNSVCMHIIRCSIGTDQATTNER